MEQLPEVGKNIYIACKKCDRERYFKVITHISATSAKTECEVCKTKKTYKLPVAKKPRVSKALAASRAKVNSDWQKMVQDRTDTKKIPYRINTKFEVDQILEHPMFGLGIVTKSLPAKIEVIFEKEMKVLIHAQVD